MTLLQIESWSTTTSVVNIQENAPSVPNEVLQMVAYALIVICGIAFWYFHKKGKHYERKMKSGSGNVGVMDKMWQNNRAALGMGILVMLGITLWFVGDAPTTIINMLK